MSKTRNAYAMRNFDSARILQRSYFNHLGLDKNRSDEEILQTVVAKDVDDLYDTKKKEAELHSILIALSQYQRRLKNHGDRLTRYARAVEYKITTDPKADIVGLRARHKRAGELSMKYCGVITTKGITCSFLGGIAVEAVGGLLKKVAEYYKVLDEKIKVHYRKIFAARLRSVRKEMKLTQAEFGQRLGLTQRGVSNFENAIYEPNLSILVTLAEEMQRPVGWFLGVN